MDTSPSRYAIIFVWLLCVAMFNSVTCSMKIRCNEKDKQILLNFKQGVIDPSGVLSTWSTQPDCCQWIGVKCDNLTSRVTELSLHCFTSLSAYTDKVDKSHCLTGDIHLSLLQLKFLNHLDLSNNDFLSLQSNSEDSLNCHNLSVTTPPCPCGNSSDLHHLDLSYNENLLIHNLQWLSRISSLNYVDLSGIDLHKETNWLQLVTMLPSLSVLSLESCQLENISPSLQYANFTALEVLDLTDNAFDSELPNWLCNLTCDIFDIVLLDNFLRGHLPKTLLNLRNLKVLNLGINHFNGTIPYWLGQLEHLQDLNLYDNLFSGPIPPNLGNLSSLIGLNVNSNLLTGVVSERYFDKLSNLKWLFMESPGIIFDFVPTGILLFNLDYVWCVV